MYAVKVPQGRERIKVRTISSGFLPSFQAKPGVRLLVVPGYVFTMVRVPGAVQVAKDEWEIIDRLTSAKPTVMDGKGQILSGPLEGFDSYVVYRGQDCIRIRVKLLGEEREYWLRCETAVKETVDEIEKKESVEDNGPLKVWTDVVAYSDEKKAAILKRADEIGYAAAAREYGLTWQTVFKMQRKAAFKPAEKKKKKKLSEIVAEQKNRIIELETELKMVKQENRELAAMVEKLKKRAECVCNDQD